MRNSPPPNRRRSRPARPKTPRGETVVAFVVAAAGDPIEPSALDALCLDHLARFERPKRYIFIDSLPKNNYGKVLKTELRARLADKPRGR
jgi:long-chain acyl-CoA synthetase